VRIFFFGRSMLLFSGGDAGKAGFTVLSGLAFLCFFFRLFFSSLTRL
jgi:hypothetical protein